MFETLNLGFNAGGATPPRSERERLTLAAAVMSKDSNRKQSYLCSTLNSIFQHFEPSSVIVYKFTPPLGDSDERTKRPRCRAEAAVRIVEVPRPADEITVLDDYEYVIRDSHRRGIRNAIVFEDDIVLESQFVASLEKLVAAPWPWRPQPPCIISLYEGFCCDSVLNMTRQNHPEIERKEDFRLGRNAWTWGTLAVLFAGGDARSSGSSGGGGTALPLLRQFADFFHDPDADKHMLQDTFITQFAKKRNIPFWGLDGQGRSLVQHIDLASELFGENSRFHWSFTFPDGTGDAPIDLQLFQAEAQNEDALNTGMSTLSTSALMLLLAAAAAAACVYAAWLSASFARKHLTKRA